MKKLLALVLFVFPLTCFGSTQIFMGSIINPQTATKNQALNQTNNGGTTANTTNAGIMPIAGTFSNLYAYSSQAPGGSANWTVTLEDGASLKAVTCTITSAVTTCNDTTHTFTAAAADLITVQFAANSAPAAASLWFSIQFSPTTVNQTAWFPNNGPTFSTTVNNYIPLASIGLGTAANETTDTVIVPEGGTFQNLYAGFGASSSPGNYVFTVRNFSGNATTTITCTVASATNCTPDTTHTYATSTPPTGSIGDRMDVAVAPNSSPTARVFAGGGIGFTPTTAGNFDFANWFNTDAQAVTRFAPLMGNGNTIVEGSTTLYAQAMTITDMQVYINTTSTAGKNRAFTIRDNSSDTSATCTISGGSTSPANNSCRWSGSLTINLGDQLDISDVPSGSPNITTGNISIVASIPATPPAASGLSIFTVFGSLFEIIGGMFMVK